ncbi:DUF2304 domain-containing protein [Candidatus Woesearchaeota archaeon]|nr:DUF2304 domain-containing protein [Candidatus Woesearchaeota archaeon]
MASTILGIQLLGILFGLFMLYYSFLHLKRKVITAKEFSLWLMLWLVFIVIALVPKVLDPIVKKLNLARTMDFFIILGFMFLFGASFYTYLLVRRNQKQIEEMVRKLALKEEK